ncbi:MAG: arylsulfatase, partial [Alphaproteobacteria bacterium]
YEIAGIRPPRAVDGVPQDPIDGISMVYTFDDASVPTRKTTQYFENAGGRGLWHEGWFAGAFGPLVPWDTAGSAAAIRVWNPDTEPWELYDLRSDYSQADDLAAKYPDKLAEMKALFLEEAKANKALPIGASLWTRIHPEDRVSTPYRSWVLDSTTTRMPEFTAPGLGRESNRVAIEAEFGAGASGVLYALGGAAGGLTLYVDRGILVYEYNMMIVEKFGARSREPIPAGKHRVEVATTIAKPGGPADVVISVDGAEVARTTVGRTVPGAFSASESLDVGTDLGSPVSLDYFDRAPFRFDGRIGTMKVDLS